MSNTFFIKTALEWAATSMNSYIIPRGDLCIETFDDGDMKLKIGDGLRVFKQLPYICHGHDDKKHDYYTKEEIDKMFDDITIDLDNYYNKTEIDQFMSSLRSDLIQYIDNNTHYHHNKEILDQITAPFTQEEKEKLANIVDISEYVERIEVLESVAHTHDNKNVLDLITIVDVNNWHAHSNKEILDNTTASFTVNYKNILDNLITYNVFEPASAYESGSVGLVPAPNVGDHVKFLRGDGKWVSVESAIIPIATTETLGGIIVGDGLTITEDGVLSTTGVLSITQDQIDENVLVIEYADHTDQITLPLSDDTYNGGVATDIRSGVIGYPENYKFIDVKYADGLAVNNNNQLYTTAVLNIQQSSNPLEIVKVTSDTTETIGITLPIASTTVLGGVKIGNGIDVDANGVISVDSHSADEYLEGDAIELKDIAIVNVPFIRFNGSSSVFDTGVVHQAHDKFELILREPTVSDRIRTVFGSRRYNTDSNDITLTIDSNQKFLFDRSSPTKTAVESTDTVSTDIIYKIIIQDKSCDIYNYETNELIEHIGDVSDWFLDDGLYTLTIGNLHNSDSMQHSNIFGDMELYEFKWYRDDVLIHDYVPYQNDSLVALYDNVTESVLQAYAGAGSLIYGTREIHISDLGSDKTINVLYADGLNINENNQLYATGVLDVSVNSGDETKLDITFWNGIKTIQMSGSGGGGGGIDYYPGEAIDIAHESISDEYQEVEYIETYNGGVSGFSYIETNYIPGPNTDLELIIAPVSGSQVFTPISISRLDSGSYTSHVYGLAWNSSAGNSIWFNRADQTTNFGGQYVELSENITNKKTKFKTTGNTLSVYDGDNNLLGTVTDESVFTSDSPFTLPIFASKIHSNDVYSTDYMYGKFYEMYIRENNTVIHHFIPCKTTDATSSVRIGIYDTISQRFYQISAYGSGGSVRLGPDVTDRTFETRINVLYNDGLDVNDDNELINTGVLDVNINQQDSSKLDIEFYDHIKTITISGSGTLQPATTEVLGGIIVGDGLSITSNGVLSANAVTIDDYVVSVTQDEEFENVLHIEYPDGTVDITIPQSEGQVEVDEPEEELIISGSYSPGNSNSSNNRMLSTANTGVLDVSVNEEDNTVLDITYYDQTKHVQMSCDPYDDTELRSLITALTAQVQQLQTEVNTLKAEDADNNETTEVEPSSSVVPTDSLATSVDNVDTMIIGDLEEV